MVEDDYEISLAIAITLSMTLSTAALSRFGTRGALTSRKCLIPYRSVQLGETHHVFSTCTELWLENVRGNR